MPTRYCLIAFVVVPSALLCLLAGGVARGQQENRLGSVARFVVNDVDTIHIFVHPTVSTKLSFDSPIHDIRRPSWKYFEFEQTASTMYLRPHSFLRDGRGIWGSISVQTRHSTLTVVVHATEDPTQAHGSVEILHRSQAEQLESVIDAKASLKAAEQCKVATEQQAQQHVKVLEEAQTLLAGTRKRAARKERQQAKLIEELRVQLSAAVKHLEELQTRLATTIQRAEEKERAHTRELAALNVKLATSTQRVQHELAQDHVIIPIHDPDPPVIHGVRVRAVAWHLFQTSGATMLELELTNLDPRPYSVADVLLFDEHGDKNHTGAVNVTAVPATVPPAGVLAMIPANGRLITTITVKDPETVGRRVTVAVREANGTRPLLRNGIPSWAYVKPPPTNQGRKTFYGKVLAGVLRVTDESIPGAQEITYLIGFGGRLTYGITDILDLDTELIYANTGEVQFMSADGEMSRRSEIIRAQFGGLLHFGDMYRPTIRAGLGMFGASVRRQVGGSDDRSFDFGLTMTGGLGLDVRVSENARVGAALSVDQPLNSDSRTFEAGFHIGYGRVGNKDDKDE